MNRTPEEKEELRQKTERELREYKLKANDSAFLVKEKKELDNYFEVLKKISDLSQFSVENQEAYIASLPNELLPGELPPGEDLLSFVRKFNSRVRTVYGIKGEERRGNTKIIKDSKLDRAKNERIKSLIQIMYSIPEVEFKFGIPTSLTHMAKFQKLLTADEDVIRMFEELAARLPQAEKEFTAQFVEESEEV